MGMIWVECKSSDELQELVNLKCQDEIMTLADSTCTNGYDNDGSTGYEIFERGFGLARRAGGRDVFQADVYGGDKTVFFIGDLKEVLERVRALSDKDKGE